jgi:peptide deformylase
MWIGEMFELLEAHGNGVGLAASQVALPYRFYITRVDGQRRVFINPTIKPQGKWITENEGCLSAPDAYGPVQRRRNVFIEAWDQDGNEIKETAKGMLSRVIQHEHDHIDGKMFFERMKERDLDMLEDDMLGFTSEYMAKVTSGEFNEDDINNELQELIRERC